MSSSVGVETFCTRFSFDSLSGIFLFSLVSVTNNSDHPFVFICFL